MSLFGYVHLNKHQEQIKGIFDFFGALAFLNQLLITLRA